MFWSRSKDPARPLESDEILEAAIRRALGDADASTVKVVTAVAGLLSAVAYVDRQISGAEALHLRSELERIHGFASEHVDAVANVLGAEARRLSTSFVPRFTRTLREELPEAGRFEVLDALLGMAAADGAISHSEIASLRNMCTALGLSQEHYNMLQAKYREKLAWLAGDDG